MTSRRPRSPVAGGKHYVAAGFPAASSTAWRAVRSRRSRSAPTTGISTAPAHDARTTPQPEHDQSFGRGVTTIAFNGKTSSPWLRTTRCSLYFRTALTTRLARDR